MSAQIKATLLNMDLTSQTLIVSLIIVYTEPDDQTIRIISLRKALSYEGKYYEQYLKNRLE